RTLLRAAAPRALASSASSPSTRRTLSTAPPRRQQASWDSIDTADAFKPATALPRDPDSRPTRPASSSSSASPSSSSSRPRYRETAPARDPRGAHNPKRKGPQAERPTEPLLPPLSRSTPVSSLDPVHLHQFRLSLLQKLGRPPSPADLARELYPWLRRAYASREQVVASELDRARRAEERRVQLDLAWEWERQAAANAGIRRTEAERRKDAVVLERIARRKRDEREARERQRDLRAADALLPAERAADASSSSSTDAEANLPAWRKHQFAMRTKFPDGWAPPKRLSREAMDLVRTLARSDPVQYSVPKLADKFKVSPEAVRRILKSRFELPVEERVRREQRRKEERARMSAAGESERPAAAAARGTEGDKAAEAAPAWGGDVAAERRELRQLR
ncbi:hypothetical protein DMC30DRAFT_331374, partial [Rhodotorula diobovata]